jgi:amino acid permease
MKYDPAWLWYAIAAAFLIAILSFAGGLFYAYVADEWLTPPADERGVPAPGTF